MTIIEVPRLEKLEFNDGYSPFIGDLQTLYNLHELNPNQLKWVGMNNRDVSFQTPNIILEVEDNTPQLAVNLYPMRDVTKVTGDVSYHAPILLSAVDRWGSSNLQQHKITRYRSVSDSDTFFKHQDSYPLSKFLEGIVEGVDDTTPVAESIALLPISPDGSYQTEFCPEIRTKEGEHRKYQIYVIMEGGFSAYPALALGSNRDIYDIDKDQNTHRWKADFIADMSDLEQLMLPSSVGHLVLIATPIEEESKPDIEKYLDDQFKYDPNDNGGSNNFNFGSQSRGARIGGVSISQGTQTGQGRIYKGELSSSSKGNPIIHHIRFLGVKPDVARGLGVPGLDSLTGAISSYDVESN